jgi:hypothetical protein
MKKKNRKYGNEVQTSEVCLGEAEANKTLLARAKTIYNEVKNVVKVNTLLN